ncbi:ROK family protein [Catalinimonas alkaloidigena]|uniref:ROK family protein n=1 Tax=Catalinimonas alkaloidigena TaxID=1075417 RepID=UPI000B7D0277|nr:ROK family protein [Catalinimonas alkaloidigena]
MESLLGIDVGGTNVKCGLVSREGKLLSKKKYSTLDLRHSGRFVEGFLDVIAEQLDEHGKVGGIGIGIPGTLSRKRKRTLELPNLPELNGVKLLSILNDRFPTVPFYLENDANAAALGEYYFGKKKLPGDFIFITLGTGIGGAAVIDKKLFKGARGNGMEIGHIVAGNGRLIEQNIGKQGIIAIARDKMMNSSFTTTLTDDDFLHSKAVVKAAHDGDALALEVFREVGMILGEALVSAIRILDITTILIGGGVSETFGYVQESMFDVMNRHLTPYYLDDLQIELATLGNNAGIIGAASLCLANE